MYNLFQQGCFSFSLQVAVFRCTFSCIYSASTREGKGKEKRQMVVNDKFIRHQSQQRLRYRAASAISTSGCSCSSNRDSCRELPANPMIKSWSFPECLSFSLSLSLSLSPSLALSSLSLLLSLLPSAFFMPPILCPRFLLSILSCHPHPLLEPPAILEHAQPTSASNR